MLTLFRWLLRATVALIVVGVLAFSLDSIAEDPDGNAATGGGSVLPRVWITVCDPTPYIGGGGVVTLPFAAQ